MPTYTGENGKDVWTSESPKPATHVGSKKTQKDRLNLRRDMVVFSTARAMGFELSEEELQEVIETNALSVEMDPEELRALATQYLEWKEANSNGIEKE